MLLRLEPHVALTSSSPNFVSAGSVVKRPGDGPPCSRYSHTTVTRAALTAFLIALPIACVMSQTCPCGETFDRDPLDPEADFFVGTDHEVSDHCFCRCGDGPEVRMPPSETCAGYEGPCERPDGAIDRLTCD